MRSALLGLGLVIVSGGAVAGGTPGGGGGCCERTIVTPPNVAPGARVGSPDGGTSTEVTTRLSASEARLT